MWLWTPSLVSFQLALCSMYRICRFISTDQSVDMLAVMVRVPRFYLFVVATSQQVSLGLASILKFVPAKIMITVGLEMTIEMSKMNE